MFMSTYHHHGHHDHHRHHGHHDEHSHGHDSVWGRIGHLLIPHSHDHAAMISDSAQATQTAERAAWVSLGAMAATAVLQLVIVWVSGSVSLLADTIHNLGHVITTIPLVVALRLAKVGPTRRFTYGLRRAEDLVGLFIGGVVAISAVLIFVDAIDAIRHPRSLENLGWVMAAAVVGALGNELVARYRIRAGQRVGSAALIAEGQHARTDALTSLAVIAGVVGAWLGYAQVDAFIGLLIGVVVVGVLLSSMKSVITRLMDGVDPDIIHVAEHVLSDQGFSESTVRARWLGHDLLLDVELPIAESQTVADLHRLHDELFDAVKLQLPRLEQISLLPSPAGGLSGRNL